MVIQRMAEAVSPRWSAFIVTAAGTGLRQGELLGLSVNRLDFFRRTLRVDRQRSVVARDAPKLTPPKTAASVRTVPLPVVVVDVLAAHLAEFPAGPDGLVLTDEDGSPVRGANCAA